MSQFHPICFLLIWISSSNSELLSYTYFIFPIYEILFIITYAYSLNGFAFFWSKRFVKIFPIKLSCLRYYQPNRSGPCQTYSIIQPTKNDYCLYFLIPYSFSDFQKLVAIRDRWDNITRLIISWFLNSFWKILSVFIFQNWEPNL